MQLLKLRWLCAVGVEERSRTEKSKPVAVGAARVLWKSNNRNKGYAGQSLRVTFGVKVKGGAL